MTAHLALLASVTLALVTSVLAQAPQVLPIVPDAWDANGLPLEFTTHLGESAMHLGPNGPTTGDGAVELRDFTFADGTLEFDHAPEDSSVFSAIHFRRRDEQNSEHAYLRTFFAGETRVNEALQYAAVVGGVNYWDISPDFQAAVALDSAGYNHVKLVARGRQLLIYVNDMTTPALYVPHMDGDIDAGRVAFAGRGYYANLTYDPSTEGLAGDEGYDPTLGDGRYVRTWRVSEPREAEATRALSTLELPGAEAFARELEAERLGLVNLSRPFGKTEQGTRRVVWLQQTIIAASDREVEVDIGFSDEVAIWVNGRLAYVDENVYGTPQMKYPRGRLSIDNARVRLPLVAGENVVTVAVANDFFGWGLVMRMRETAGLAW